MIYNLRLLEAGPYFAEVESSDDNWPQLTAEFCVTSPLDTFTSHETAFDKVISPQSTSETTIASTPQDTRPNMKRKSSIKMISRLEDVLLQHGPENPLRQKLFGYLDDADMRNLRVASKVLNTLVLKNPMRVLGDLYVRAPLNESDHLHGFENIALCCQTLTISVGDRSEETVSKHLVSTFGRGRSIFRASTRGNRGRSRPPLHPIVSDNQITQPPIRQTPEKRASQEDSYRQWLRIFSRMQELCTITLRVDDNDSAWPGRTDLEDALVTLRTAIEESAASLPLLKEVRLTPIHAMGVTHLRWNSLSRFTPSGNGSILYKPSVPLLPTPSMVWQNLHRLHLHVRNPSASSDPLSAAQSLMFQKLLFDYLRGFEDTLRTLHFVWLGADGPSPLTLHEEPGLKHRPHLLWRKLQELWLGNTTFTHRTIKLLPEVAPLCTVMKTLRSGGHSHTHSLDSVHNPKKRVSNRPKTTPAAPMDPTDPSSWVDVLIGPTFEPAMRMLHISPPEPARGKGARIYPVSISSVYSSHSNLCLSTTPPLLTPDHSPEHSPERSPTLPTPTSSPAEDDAVARKRRDRNIWGSVHVKESVQHHQQQGLADRGLSIPSDGSVSRTSRVVPFMLDMTGRAGKRILFGSRGASGLSPPSSSNNSNEQLVVTPL